MGERENVDGEQQVEDGIEGTGGGNERDETLHEGSEQVGLEIVAVEETAGHGSMQGSKTVKVRSGCNSLNCVVEHRWGGSEDGRQVEESLGSYVRDEVEGEQQDVM